MDVYNDDSKLDKATALRRERNRIAQQKHRQKTKTHEADLDERTATVHKENAALENKTQELRQKQEEAEQYMRYMVTDWEQVRAALQVGDYHRAAIGVFAPSFEGYRDRTAESSSPKNTTKQLEF